MPGISGRSCCSTAARSCEARSMAWSRWQHMSLSMGLPCKVLNRGCRKEHCEDGKGWSLLRTLSSSSFATVLALLTQYQAHVAAGKVLCPSVKLIGMDATY